MSTPLRFSIGVVIGGCSCEQMRRVYTRRVVAAVKNAVTFRYWANVHFIGKAMRLFHPAPIRPSVTNCPVAVSVFALARPFPAFTLRALAGSFIHVFPKANFYGFAYSGKVAFSHDLNLRYRSGLWSGSSVADNNVRAACILALLS